MAVKLLCLCLSLLPLLSLSWTKEQTCPSSASNCNECMRAGPECAWCTDPQSKIHCNTYTKLQKAGCQISHMYYPQGGVQVVKNDSRSEPAEVMFLQPQELSLRLRPGVSQRFPLTITQAGDQPVTNLTLDTSPVPAGVNITFSIITNGNPVVIEVNVEAAQCASESNQEQNSTGPWSFQITPRGFSSSLKIQLTLECQCDCMRDREENSPSCSGHGALVCGQCECTEPYIGQHCERHVDASADDHLCREGPHAPVCSGRGQCMEDYCICDRPANPANRYSGMFCQCSNFDCPYHNNKLCGGHGLCQCGRCVCDDNWTDDDCSCSLETASCMATNQQLCNGRGSCLCGICKCTDPKFMGPTCESCPLCPGVCTQHALCVECRAFGTGSLKNNCEEKCGYLNVTVVETRDDLQTSGFESGIAHCKEMSHDDSCFFYYTFSSPPSGGQATVARAKDCWGRRGRST